MLIGLSKGWKFGIIPTKLGRGSIGVRDFGLWLIGLGSSISGGGMRCFDARKSKDYSVFLIESCSSYC